MKIDTLNNTNIEISKTSIQQTINEINDALDNEQYNALKIALDIKYFQEVLDGIKDKLREKVLDSLSKYHKNEKIMIYGNEYIIKESGVKYDYTNCNDSYYNDLINEINKLNELKAHREAFLKTLQSKTNIVDEDTGEINEINPPIKSSTTTYQIKLQK